MIAIENQLIAFWGVQAQAKPVANLACRIALCPDGITARPSNGSEIQDTFLAIPGHEPWQLECASPMLVLYLEPELACTRLHRGIAGELMPEMRSFELAVKEIIPEWEKTASTLAAWSKYWETKLPALNLPDPRLSHLVEQINQAPTAHFRLERLAESVALSPSHVQHLFKAEMGINLTNFLHWKRLRVAIQFRHRGYSFTASAYAAGFADGPHFSRIFSRVFGHPPSRFLV